MKFLLIFIFLDTVYHHQSWSQYGQFRWMLEKLLPGGEMNSPVPCSWLSPHCQNNTMSQKHYMTERWWMKAFSDQEFTNSENANMANLYLEFIGLQINIMINKGIIWNPLAYLSFLRSFFMLFIVWATQANTNPFQLSSGSAIPITMR